MKLLLLVVLVWTASDEASADAVNVRDYEKPDLIKKKAEPDLSSIQEKYKNLALHGRPTMSSIYKDTDWGYLGMAVNAIDGNPDTDLYHGSCFHTHRELSPWWRVDLLESYTIHYITITNRDAYGSRINGAEILVGDSLTNNGNSNPRCALVTSLPDGGTQTYACGAMVGRYVNIVLAGQTEVLHLCEVQIFGEQSPEVKI
ncbi:fucolectin-like [Engystomops pustulosus]|uniref:fucolectin-like n=1 Tax=Engystomops pustulosus TaxID=76066 RepID=UPI003AFA5796